MTKYEKFLEVLDSSGNKGIAAVFRNQTDQSGIVRSSVYLINQLTLISTDCPFGGFIESLTYICINAIH